MENMGGMMEGLGGIDPSQASFGIISLLEKSSLAWLDHGNAGRKHAKDDGWKDERSKMSRRPWPRHLGRFLIRED